VSLFSEKVTYNTYTIYIVTICENLSVRSFQKSGHLIDLWEFLDPNFHHLAKGQRLFKCCCELGDPVAFLGSQSRWFRSLLLLFCSYVFVRAKIGFFLWESQLWQDVAVSGFILVVFKNYFWSSCKRILLI